MPLDRAVLEWLAGHRTGPVTAVARGLMAVGTEPVPLLVVALLALAVVAALRAWRAALLAAATVGVLTDVLELVLRRPRPGPGASRSSC